MPWATINEAAAALGVSPRTVEGRIARDEVASYLEGDRDQGTARRLVWVGPMVDAAALQADELRQLREAVEALTKRLDTPIRRQAQTADARPAGQVLRVTPTPDRPAQALPGPRPKRPAAATPATSSGAGPELVERLIALCGDSCVEAAAALGLKNPERAGRVSVSRWRSGKRGMSRKTVAKIEAAIISLEKLAA